MYIEIYENLDLVKDTSQNNIWLLNADENTPSNIHYDEVVSDSLYPTVIKLPALFKVILQWVKETTGKAWDWDYKVFVQNRESLKASHSDSYIVPFDKIVEV